MKLCNLELRLSAQIRLTFGALVVMKLAVRRWRKRKAHLFASIALKESFPRCSSNSSLNAIAQSDPNVDDTLEDIAEENEEYDDEMQAGGTEDIV